jgi:hypothetical protein
MKNIIKKILKEESEDFEWTNQIDPLDHFGEYFEISAASKFVRRDFDFWEGWIENVMQAYANIIDDIDGAKQMITELVNADNASKETEYLANEVLSYFSPVRGLNGLNFFEDMARTIKHSYDYFGEFARENNLTMLETMDIFKDWLEREKSTKKSLHEK